MNRFQEPRETERKQAPESQRETQRQSRQLRGGTDRVGKETYMGRIVREEKWLKKTLSLKYRTKYGGWQEPATANDLYLRGSKSKS